MAAFLEVRLWTDYPACLIIRFGDIVNRSGEYKFARLNDLYIFMVAGMRFCSPNGVGGVVGPGGIGTEDKTMTR